MDYMISSQPRYDHFDTSPCTLFARFGKERILLYHRSEKKQALSPKFSVPFRRGGQAALFFSQYKGISRAKVTMASSKNSQYAGT